MGCEALIRTACAVGAVSCRTLVQLAEAGQAASSLHVACHNTAAGMSERVAQWEGGGMLGAADGCCWVCEEHTDPGLLTLLMSPCETGLQVRACDMCGAVAVAVGMEAELEQLNLDLRKLKQQLTHGVVWSRHVGWGMGTVCCVACLTRAHIRHAQPHVNACGASSQAESQPTCSIHGSSSLLR